MSGGTLAGRRGLSVAEILVALVVATVALTAVFHLFRSSRDAAGSAEERAGILHQGRMLMEYLKRDLRCLAPAPGTRGTGVTAASGEVALDVARGVDGGTERIGYRFDPAGGTVTRDGGGDGAKVFGTARARVREFAVREVPREAGDVSCVAYAVTLALTDGEGEARSRVRLEEKVYPAVLSTRRGFDRTQ